MSPMLKTRLRLMSSVLFGALSLFMIWFGVTYARVTHMLWFHAAAVPERAREDILPLYHALMTLIGGASIAVGVLCGYVILGPLRAGARGAGAVLALSLGIAFAMAAITAEKLAATGAPTSWHLMGILLAVTAAAYAADVMARR